jgi:Cu/Ag efflux protein CusF
MSRFFSLMLVLSLVLVLGLTSAAMAADAKGKIKSVAADKNEFVVTDKDGKDWTFQMDPTAKVSLNDKAGKLNELKAGDEVDITYKKDGDKLICTEVKAKRA